jgi:hypothetical protein
MTRNALHLGLLLLGLVAACDIITPSADDGGRRDEPGLAEAPPLPPCVENRDCRGGELCVVEPDEDTGRCREVCEVDDDCDDAFYATCDRSAGYCVQCVGDEQCDDAEACVDQLCAFFCRKDDDCGGRAFCDEGSGECLDRECSVDNDCSGGFTCEDFRCVSILPLVCTADAIRCVEGGIETCNGDGTAAGVERCADGEGCIDDTDGPRCAALVCVPDEIGCEDNGAAFICDASGTQRTLLPCRNDQYCDAGVCREQVCAPDSAACSGATRVVCDERGATTTAVPCATESRCADSAFGCACRDVGGDASCVVRVCEPGVGQCVGNGARVCADDGSGFSAVTNCGADECVVGRCLPSLCTPGTTFCSGDALLTCEADGGGYRTTDCAGTCAGSDGAAACVARVCEPGSVRCAADNGAVLVCNARGTAETSTACDGGFCASGSCQAQVCEPLARRCGSDTSALVCDALGSAEQVVACGAGESCSGAGVCGAVVGAENTNAACSDGISNDGDTFIDCDDFDCADNDAVTVCGAADLSIRLTWNTPGGDVDLHLARSSPATFCGTDNCYYGARAPGWGARLDIDDQSGFGPELITFPRPADGRYTVLVDPFSVGNASVQTTVQVRRAGEVLRESSRTLRQGEQWIPLVVVVSSGAISIETVNRIEERSEGCLGNAPSPPGAVCTQSSNCPLDNFCDVSLGRCVAGCEVDGDCGQGRRCNANGSCEDVNSGGGYGARCGVDADCNQLLVCGNGGQCVETCSGNGLFDCAVCAVATGALCQCLSVPGFNEPICSG